MSIQDEEHVETNRKNAHALYAIRLGGGGAQWGRQTSIPNPNCGPSSSGCRSWQCAMYTSFNKFLQTRREKGICSQSQGRCWVGICQISSSSSGFSFRSQLFRGPTPMPGSTWWVGGTLNSLIDVGHGNSHNENQMWAMLICNLRHIFSSVLLVWVIGKLSWAVFLFCLWKVIVLFYVRCWSEISRKTEGKTLDFGPTLIPP